MFKIKGCGWIKEESILSVLQLHSSDYEKAKKKLMIGDYNLYYYNSLNKLIHSILRFTVKKEGCSAYFENGLSEKEQYTYNGLFDIYDDFIYVELMSSTDNEKINMIIKIYPGKLNLSFGIIVGQGTSKQAVATDFIISKEEITDEKTIESFKNNQKRIIADDSMIVGIKQRLNN